MEPDLHDASTNELIEIIADEADLSTEGEQALAELVNRKNDPEETTPDSLWDVKDVADRLNVCKSTVEKIIHQGEIEPIWIRGQRRFDPDAIDAYCRRQVGSKSR